MSIQLFFTLFKYVVSNVYFPLVYNINFAVMKKYSYDYQSQLLKCK